MRNRYILLVLILLALFIGDSDGQKKQLNVFTWAGYVSDDIREGFEKEFGASVLIDTYASNEDLLAKLLAGATGYDIIMPSDYMVSILIKQDLLAELNRDNISNFQNISPLFLGKYFDTENQYSIPYTFGTAGIAYDSAVVSPAPDSWTVLWDTQYKNQFSMLDDQRETIGAALKLLGYSLNTTDPMEINAAKEKLIAQKPLVKQYKSEAEELLIAGDVVMAHCWSGDAFRATETRPTIRYVIPKEGQASSSTRSAFRNPHRIRHSLSSLSTISFVPRSMPGLRLLRNTGPACPQQKNIYRNICGNTNLSIQRKRFWNPLNG